MISPTGIFDEEHRSRLFMSRVRAHSASAILQSHPKYRVSLFEDNTGARPETALKQTQSHKEGKTRPQTQYDKAKSKTFHLSPKELERKKQKARRPTLSGVQDFDEKIIPERLPEIQEDSITLNLKDKIEEKINLDILESIKEAFIQADIDGSGQLDLEEFKGLLKDKLGVSNDKEHQIAALFEKIDWSSGGTISWDEFCTYMQLEYEDKEEAYVRSREVAFAVPARVENTPHRDNVTRMTSTSDGSFIALSSDGWLSFWNTGLEMKKFKALVTPEQSQRSNNQKWVTDFVVMNEFNKFVISTGDRGIEFFEMSSFEPYCRISGLYTAPQILDYSCNKENTDESTLLWADTEGGVNILDLSATGESLRTWKKCAPVEGIACVKLDAVITAPNVSYMWWKVHKDWITYMKFYPSIREVITCSNNDKLALVKGCPWRLRSDHSGSSSHASHPTSIRDSVSTGPQTMGARRAVGAGGVGGGGQSSSSAHAPPRSALATERQRYIPGTRALRDTDHSAFDVYKGVKTFDFSKSKNILVTGGMDRNIRIWNPYVNEKPTGVLRGHESPIFKLVIAEDENLIFSISMDKCIKAWDIHDHNILLTLRPKGHKIRGDLLACHFSPTSKALMFATDQMSMLTMKNNEATIARLTDEKNQKCDYHAGFYMGATAVAEQAVEDKKVTMHMDAVVTHKDSVNAVLYNATFSHIITCAENSTVKVWDAETGAFQFEFTKAHGDAGVTCMALDMSKRRLITGGRDGLLRVWNYHNGHCLRELRKQSSTDDIQEVTSVEYVEINRNKFVVSVGWDRTINLFVDNIAKSVHHVQYQLPRWEDDARNGHREDVLCVTSCPPNHLATSAYDGRIIIWNIVSGHVFCTLTAPPVPGYKDENMDGDLSIAALVFLQTRCSLKGSASLVATGPRSYIHLWSIHYGGRLMARFAPQTRPGHMISAVAVNEANTRLCVGDRFGFLSLWNINNYCLDGPEDNPPEKLEAWRGHTALISSMQMIERSGACVVVTASHDHMVRVWALSDGGTHVSFVGVLGQPTAWSIYDTAGHQQPHLPLDVVFDTRFVPDVSALEARQKAARIARKNTAAAAAAAQGESAGRIIDDDTATVGGSIQQQRMSQISDDEIAEEIIQGKYKKGHGKRLRYERRAAVPRMEWSTGGRNEYSMLHCSELAETPEAMVEPEWLRSQLTAAASGNS